MPLWSRSRRAAILACLTAASLLPRVAFAQDPSTSGAASGSASSDGQLSVAKQLAEQANDLYQKGEYREAIKAYLEASRLDPNSPDAPILVRNIAVLHEKLGEVDDALEFFKKYGEMDISPDLKKKNEIDIHRLEGAKRELDEKQAAEKAREDALNKAAAQAPPPEKGRIDGLTIGFAAGTVVFLGVGTILGLRANAVRPPNGFVTGRDGTYEDLANRTTVAHRDAVFADVGFGVGIAAAVTTVLLYVLRDKDPAKPASTEPPPVNVAPTQGGAALLIGGTF